MLRPAAWPRPRARSAIAIPAWAPMAGCWSGPLRARRADAEIRLFNADGSEPELSGNGTRCAAAFLLDMGVVKGSELGIATGAGVKTPAPDRPRRPAFHLRDEHGPAGVRPSRTAAGAAARQRHARSRGAVGGQSPVRRFRRELRFRLAPHGGGNRALSAFPESHQRLVRAARSTRTRSRCAFSSAA